MDLHVEMGLDEIPWVIHPLVSLRSVQQKENVEHKLCQLRLLAALNLINSC